MAVLSADGAYDVMGVYEAAQRKGEGRRVRVLIPPGREARSRTFDGQRVEVQLASKFLNAMTRLGMPDSYRVA